MDGDTVSGMQIWFDYETPRARVMVHEALGIIYHANRGCLMEQERCEHDKQSLLQLG